MRVRLREVKLLWHKARVSAKPRGQESGSEKGSPKKRRVRTEG